jgi:hypothetical protein
MTCPSLSCPYEDKPREYPAISTASNYTSLKRDRVLYSQYSLNTDKVICTINPSAIYKSYELRRNIKYGCFWNQRICLKTCLSETER